MYFDEEAGVYKKYGTTPMENACWVFMKNGDWIKIDESGCFSAGRVLTCDKYNSLQVSAYDFDSLT